MAGEKAGQKVMQNMRVKFYCDLYISESWKNKKEKLVEKLQKNKLQPLVYVIALAQGEQNQLEIFSSLLLKQHVFDDSSLFVVGITSGYEEALDVIESISEEVYKKTDGLDIRRFILKRQEEFEKTEV